MASRTGKPVEATSLFQEDEAAGEIDRDEGIDP